MKTAFMVFGLTVTLCSCGNYFHEAMVSKDTGATPTTNGPGIGTGTPTTGNTNSNSLFTAIYDGSLSDEAVKIIETGSGYLIAGNTTSGSYGGYDIILMTTDRFGNITKQMLLGGTADDTVKDVLKTSDGGFLITGTTWSFGKGSSDIWIIKLTSALDIEWEKSFGGDDEEWAAGCVELSSGTFIIIGNTKSFGAGGTDILNLNVSQDGSLSGAYALGKQYNDVAEGLILNSGQSYLLYGEWQESSSSTYSALLYQADRALDIEASAQLVSGSNMYCRSAFKLPSGDGYIALIDTNAYSSATSDNAIMAVRTGIDAQIATIAWQKSFYGSKGAYGKKIIGGYNGHCVIAGYTNSFGYGNNDIWMLNIDYAGNIANEFAFGSAGQEYASDIISNSDGGFTCVGKCTSFNCVSNGIYLNTFGSDFSTGSSSTAPMATSASTTTVTRAAASGPEYLYSTITSSVTAMVTHATVRDGGEGVVFF